MVDSEWVLQLLELFSGDDNEDLMWTCSSSGQLRFAVKCSDTYWWATADCEDIGITDLPALRQAKMDALSTDSAYLWPTLWVSRKRKLRPMRGLYNSVDTAFRELLDASGPERDPKDEG